MSPINEVVVTDEEMNHYLCFPEFYCKRCNKPHGKVVGLKRIHCDECLEKVIEEDEISRAMRDMYDEDDLT